MHKFYHADRSGLLQQDQNLELDGNQLSRFGAEYWPKISKLETSEMDANQLREFSLEEIRKRSKFENYASRFQCIFGANSIEDAKRFAETIVPASVSAIPIIEIFAEKFWTFDMNWLDFDCDQEQKLVYYQHYWYAEISNHRPKKGERKPPLLEVMIALPAQTGRVVDIIDPIKV